MKKPTILMLVRTIPAFLLLLFIQLSAQAQDRVRLNEDNISAWFSRNWMWVAGGVVLLLLLFLLGRGSSKRRTTTVVKDDVGNVRSVTTTEIKE